MREGELGFEILRWNEDPSFSEWSMVVLYFYMTLDCLHLTTPFSFGTLQCCSFAFKHQKKSNKTSPHGIWNAFEETVREGSAGRGLLSAFQKKAGQFFP